MSLIEIIRDLVSSFPLIDKLCHVDHTSKKPIGYSLYPSGEIKLFEYMSGSSVWQYNFTLEVSKFTYNDLERISNCEFVEEFQHWLDAFGRKGLDLGIGKQFIGLEAQNGVYVMSEENEQSGLYQIPCTLTYERKRI